MCHLASMSYVWSSRSDLSWRNQISHSDTSPWDGETADNKLEAEVTVTIEDTFMSVFSFK